MRASLIAVSLVLAGCQGSSSAGSVGASPSASASVAAVASSAPVVVTSAAPSASAPFVEPTTVIAQHVLITYKGAKNAPKGVTRSKDDARALATKVRDEAKGGKAFEDLVTTYSEDPESKTRLGSVGKVTKDKLVKPFADAAFALRVNEVSDVTESPFGFHVIKRSQ
jgi:NIMA-interacting peptidyl-prolyl cis-trans isomerase 1